MFGGRIEEDPFDAVTPGGGDDPGDGIDGVLIGGSLVPRSLCHSVSEPCGSHRSADRAC